MDSEIGKALIALVITGIIGGIIKVYFDYKSALLANIWEKRLEAYMQFVKKTSLFPLYPRRVVKWREVFQLSGEFRDWYFEGHGLVTSVAFRDKYFALQKYILEITDGRTGSDEALSNDAYDDMRERCSQIRSLMARELESRESPLWHRFHREHEV